LMVFFLGPSLDLSSKWMSELASNSPAAYSLSKIHRSVAMYFIMQRKYYFAP
jgi:hypothetical protein